MFKRQTMNTEAEMLPCVVWENAVEQTTQQANVPGAVACLSTPTYAGGTRLCATPESDPVVKNMCHL
jgi:hypothetical protein